MAERDAAHVVESTDASHAVLVSHPNTVADLIDTAARRPRPSPKNRLERTLEF